MIKNLNEKITEIKSFDQNIKANERYIPNNLMLEVTNDCNSKCIFCANHNMTRKRKFINKAIVTKALKQSRELGVKELGLYTNGEPLLNTNIDNYIKQAKDFSYDYIYITTNGILANKEKIRKLFELGLNSIKFSINSIEGKNYATTQGIDCFNIVMENLRSVYHMKKENFPDRKVYVSYIKTKFNNYHNFEIKRMFQKYCDNISIQDVRNQGGLIANIDDLVFDTQNNIKLPCFYPFNSIVVTCEGYVTACCMDFQNYLVYGDLNKDNLKDIWNNDVINDFREKQLNKKVENTICENCCSNKFKDCEALLQDFSCKIDFGDWRKNGKIIESSQ